MPLHLQDSASEEDLSSNKSSESEGGIDKSSAAPTQDSDSDVDSVKQLQNYSGSQDSQEPHGDADSTTSETDSREAERLAAIRRGRTAKARAAAIVSKTMRRMARHAVHQYPSHPANEYRQDITSRNALIQPGANRARRCRLLCSYMKSWGPAITQAVRRRQRSSRVTHCLTTSIVDDTNMKLSSVVPGVQWKMSRIVSVMNNCQSFILGYTEDQGGDVVQRHDHFPIATPPAILPKTDRDGLCAEFVSRLFAFLGAICSRFHIWGVPQDLISGIQIQAVGLCFDSLATNLAVLKQFRLATWRKHQDQDTCDKVFPLIACCCLIHQLCLARKPLIQGFANVYTTILRLSHLFEVHSFRVHFRSALLHVLCNSFVYVAVPELPAEASSWKEFRRHCCSMITDQLTGYNKKRFQLHGELMLYDNSDCESPTITHYCIGSCCKGDSPEAKSQYARLQICRLYLLLFSFGYPVPLQYRWLHVHRALRYSRDTWFFN